MNKIDFSCTVKYILIKILFHKLYDNKFLFFNNIKIEKSKINENLIYNVITIYYMLNF